MNASTLERAIDFIDPWIRLRTQDEQYPATNVTIMHMGNVAMSVSTGYANIETREPLTADHLFQAASQTKTLTAMATLQLAEAGKLRLGDTVGQYIPEATSNTRFARASIEALLSHGVGIVRDVSDADFWGLQRPFPTRSELLDGIINGGVIEGADAQMKYSNPGYGALGIILERVSGIPYEQLIHSRVLSPLGLTRSRISARTMPRHAIAQGYSRQSSGGVRLPFPRLVSEAYTPAAGLYSTPQELCVVYDQLIPGDRAVLLGDIALKDMITPRWNVPNSPNVEYGLGTDMGQLNGRKVYGHGGGYPGYMSKTLVDVDNQVVVSGMATCIDADALMMTIGAMEALDYFRRYEEKPDVPLDHFNAFVSDIWRDRQIVVAGNRIVAINPHSWHPFAGAEELVYVDSDTLRIRNANGFSHEGELVRFFPDHIVYGGRTMIKTNIAQDN